SHCLAANFFNSDRSSPRGGGAASKGPTIEKRRCAQRWCALAFSSSNIGILPTTAKPYQRPRAGIIRHPLREHVHPQQQPFKIPIVPLLRFTIDSTLMRGKNWRSSTTLFGAVSG